MLYPVPARRPRRHRQDIRNRADTQYHPVGHLQEAVSDAKAVVDARLRVHGTAGLRVVDASIMPTLWEATPTHPRS